MKRLTISVAARRVLVYLYHRATFCLTHYMEQISQRSASCPAGQKSAVIFRTK